MGPMFNLEFLKNYDFWYGFGFIGGACFGALLAYTGNEVGHVEPRYLWVWGLGLAACGSLVIVIRTVEKKHILAMQGKLDAVVKTLENE